MGQFPVTPSREKILAKFPDYAVAILPAETSVTVTIDGKVIARSDNALLVRETKHADVYYLPPRDVIMSQLTKTGHSTYCPFKGHASYWTLHSGSREEPNIVWSYENPYPEVMELKGYMSFYSNRSSIETGKGHRSLSNKPAGDTL